MDDGMRHLAQLMRRQAWDTYASAALGMSLHPGTTRDAVTPRRPDEIAAIADAMLAERDKRFAPLNDDQGGTP